MSERAIREAMQKIASWATPEELREALHKDISAFPEAAASLDLEHPIDFEDAYRGAVLLARSVVST